MKLLRLSCRNNKKYSDECIDLEPLSNKAHSEMYSSWYSNYFFLGQIGILQSKVSQRILLNNEFVEARAQCVSQSFGIWSVSIQIKHPREGSRNRMSLWSPNKKRLENLRLKISFKENSTTTYTYHTANLQNEYWRSSRMVCVTSDQYTPRRVVFENKCNFFPILVNDVFPLILKFSP